MKRAVALLIVAGCTLPSGVRSPSSFYALALSPSRDRVEVIDLLVNRTIEHLNTGDKPVSLGVNGDGTRILVANQNDGTVNAFLRRDPETFVDLGTVGIGERPRSVQFHPDPKVREAYVTDEKTGQLVVLDWRRSFQMPQVAAKFPIRLADEKSEVSPTLLAVSPDGGRLFAADRQGRVHIMSRTGLGQVSMQSSVTVDTASTGGVRIEGIASVDSNLVLVTNAAKSDLFVLDAANGTVRSVVDLTGDRGPQPVAPAGVAVNPARTKAYVACAGSNSVAVVDLRTMRLVKHVVLSELGTSESGGAPNSVAVTPDNLRVYVTNSAGRHLSVIQADPAGNDFLINGVGLASSAALLAPLSEIRLL